MKMFKFALFRVAELLLLIVIIGLITLAFDVQAAEKEPPAKRSAVEDKWTGGDKVLHAAVGAGVGLAVYGIAEANGASYPRLIGFSAGCGLGVAKEAMDSRFSSKDAVVTCVAAAAGAYLGGVMIEHHRKTTTVSYNWEF